MSHHCLHVKIKATPVDLADMGILPEIQKILLSGRAFAVSRRTKTDDNRWALMLLCPVKQIDLAWIYEDLTEPIQ